MDCKSFILQFESGYRLRNLFLTKNKKKRRPGGMVDTIDLKSVDLLCRESSSLSASIVVLLLILSILANLF